MFESKLYASYGWFKSNSDIFESQKKRKKDKNTLFIHCFNNEDLIL